MVDLSFLEKFTKGNKDKMKRYINMYLSVAPDTFNKMKQNIIEEDWEQLRIHAHSLKPQADFMGIASLKNLLIEIENAVRDNKLDGLDLLHEKAFQLNSESEVFLKEYIKILE